MGEKSAALTITLWVIVAFVALLFVATEAYPLLAESITNKMQGIVDNTFSAVDGTSTP